MPLAKSLKFRFRDRLGKAFVYTRVNRGDALRRDPEELGQVLGGTPGDGDNCRGAAQAAHSKRAVIDAPGTSQNFWHTQEGQVVQCYYAGASAWQKFGKHIGRRVQHLNASLANKRGKR